MPNNLDTTFHTPDFVEEGIDPLYLRQAPLLFDIPNRVVIVGCGGVGVWVALALALAGVPTLDLFDGDTLSTHNLNRFPLPASLIGESKSLALAKWLGTLRPNSTFNARGAFEEGVNSDFLDSGTVSWLVCATDSLKSRNICHDLAVKYGIFYLEIGADGEGWSLSPAPPEFSTEEEETPGYTSVPVHVGPCMMAGAAAAYYILHNVNLHYSYSGNWARVKSDSREEGLHFGRISEESMTGEVEDLGEGDPEEMEVEDNGTPEEE